MTFTRWTFRLADARDPVLGKPANQCQFSGCTRVKTGRFIWKETGLSYDLCTVHSRGFALTE